MDKNSESSNISAAAKVIFLYREGRPPKELYDLIFDGYDGLIEIFGNPRRAEEASRVLGIAPSSVRKYAGRLIDFLLFNPENNPYVSLGLPGFGSFDEVTRRWKRLLLLYHPDRSSREEAGLEERAKKINDSYGKIRLLRASPAPPEVRINKMPVRRPHPETIRIHRFKYLKYLPHIILAIVVLIAILSAALFFSYLGHPESSGSSGEAAVAAPSAAADKAPESP